MLIVMASEKIFRLWTPRVLLSILIALLIFQPPNIYSSMSTSTPIKHVVIILQENHSFDNYFGTYPTANGTLHDNLTRSLQPVNGIPNAVCLPYLSGCLSPY